MTTTNSRIQQQPPVTAAAKVTKELSFGSKVGRGLQKLTELNEAEENELVNSPESIKSRYAKKRAELLDGLESPVKAAVLAAAVAVQPVKSAAE